MKIEDSWINDAMSDDAGRAEPRGKIVPSPRARAPQDAAVNRDIVWRDPGMPKAQGLYDPSKEHDSCGVGFVANMHNEKSHDIVEKGLQILLNIDHRGATGADPGAGDGCGMLLQIPHEFFVEKAEGLGFKLPAEGEYAIGVMFLPKDSEAADEIAGIVEETIAAEGFRLLGWRDVPVDPSHLGESVKPSEPLTRQVFVGRGPSHTDQELFERRLFVLRKQISNEVFSCGDPSVLPAITPFRCRRGRSSTRACLLATRLGRVLPPTSRDPSASRLGPGAGAPALLDQHLPGLVS